MNVVLALIFLSVGTGASPSLPEPTSVLRTVVTEVAEEVERFYTRFSEPMPQLLVGGSTVTPCDLCVSGATNAAYAGAHYSEKRLPIERWDELRTLLQSELLAGMVEKDRADLPPLGRLDNVVIVNLQPYTRDDSVNSSIAYEDYPEAGAILRLSAPSVDPDSSQALVYAELTMVHSVDMRFYLLGKNADEEWIVQWTAPVLFFGE